MTTIQRPFLDESDKSIMLEVANQFPADNLHVTDLPYRLCSWAFDNPDNIGLWFNEKKHLLAWAVLQVPFWEIDLVCHPAFSLSLHPEILAWADRRAIASIDTPFGHPSWYINVFAGQVDRIQNLEGTGFKPQADVGEDSLSKVLLQRSIQTVVKIYEPPLGYVVRPLAGKPEIEMYVELHRSVFESKNMTVEWRRRILNHPAYKPELDIVVESPDRRLTAFCVSWTSENNLVGRVEPLGCHKDYRKYALGRVALSEGLHRLQSLGAKKIFVETDNYRNTALHLYESFDFQVYRNVLVYRKDYSI
ncbi:MAG: GNAT family N-acetyltransferase [Anaerolineales bacterium]